MAGMNPFPYLIKNFNFPPFIPISIEINIYLITYWIGYYLEMLLSCFTFNRTI